MPDDIMTVDIKASDTEVRRLARVLDDAWERMIALHGAEEATDANRARLAARIVWLAQQGERDEQTLSDAAATYLCALIVAGKLRREAPHDAERFASKFGGREPKPFRQDMGSGYDPQAQAAMEEGLALCREALPDPISSTVTTFLSKTILDHAASGERDAVRLCNHALDALRSRR